MKAVLKKIISVFCAIVILLSPIIAHADGMLIELGDDSSTWNYSTEKSQQAYISHSNGRENMIVSIDMEESNGKDRFWILPIPANPDKTTIDIVSSLPYFGGNEVTKEAKSNFKAVSDIIFSSQLYTIAYLMVKDTYFRATNSKYSDADTMTFGGTTQDNEVLGDVNVYDQVSQFGITTELVTTKTKDGLFGHLQEKGLEVEAGSLSSLDSYIGQDYCFAVSWIVDKMEMSREIVIQHINDHLSLTEYYPDLETEFFYIERDNPEIENFINQKQISGDKMTVYSSARTEYLETYPNIKEQLIQKIVDNPYIITNNYDNNGNSNSRGLFVSFPTEKIFFPLMPTSVYGSKIVPATIRVIGDYKPNIVGDIKNFTKTEYYRESSEGSIYNIEKLNIGSDKIQNYTKITMNPPSKLLDEDLWLEPGISTNARIARAISQNIVLFGIFYFLILSLISAAATSIIVFKEARGKNLYKYATIGLFNVFSLAGLIMATIFWPTIEIQEKDRDLIKIIKDRGHSTFWLKALDKRKLIFIPAFSIILLIINWLVSQIAGV